MRASRIVLNAGKKYKEEIHMRTVHVTVHTENAAFEDKGAEVAKVLRELAEGFERGGNPSSARDTNGNKVAFVDYE